MERLKWDEMQGSRALAFKPIPYFEKAYFSLSATPQKCVLNPIGLALELRSLQLTLSCLRRAKLPPS